MSGIPEEANGGSRSSRRLSADVVPGIASEAAKEFGDPPVRTTLLVREPLGAGLPVDRFEPWRLLQPDGPSFYHQCGLVVRIV
jgi:hypothetical protein